MSPRTEPDSGPSPNNHFPGRLVAFLVLTASSAYLCRVDVTVVAPRLMAEFQLSQAQMGELFSAFLVGYTAFQIPSGWVADRMAVRPLFLALALGWALVTAALTATGWSPFGAVLSPLLVLLLLRLFFGILAAPTYPAAGRAIAVHVPARLQGRANGFVLASIGIGSAVTPLLLGPVSVRWGWRPAVLVAASGGRQSPHAPNGVFRGAEARVATSNDSVALAAFAAQLLVFGRKLHTPGLRRLRLCVLDIHLSSPGQGFRPAESRLAHSPAVGLHPDCNPARRGAL